MAKPGASEVTKPAKPSQPTKKVPASRGSKAEPSPKQGRPDWEAIERDYRTGRFTVRELEAKHGPNNGNIARRAKKEGWTQDLTSAVRKATNAALVSELVQQECSSAQQNAAVAVLAAAEVNKQVILGHRKMAGGALKLVAELMAELCAIGTSAQDLERLAEVAGGDDPDEMLKVIRKVTSVHSRTSSIKTLADALDKLVKIERAAFGIDDADGGKAADDLPPSSMTPSDAYLYMVQGKR